MAFNMLSYVCARVIVVAHKATQAQSRILMHGRTNVWTSILRVPSITRNLLQIQNLVPLPVSVKKLRNRLTLRKLVILEGAVVTSELTSRGQPRFYSHLRTTHSHAGVRHFIINQLELRVRPDKAPRGRRRTGASGLRLCVEFGLPRQHQQRCWTCCCSCDSSSGLPGHCWHRHRRSFQKLLGATLVVALRFERRSYWHWPCTWPPNGICGSEAPSACRCEAACANFWRVSCLCELLKGKLGHTFQIYSCRRRARPGAVNCWRQWGIVRVELVHWFRQLVELLQCWGHTATALS